MATPADEPKDVLDFKFRSIRKVRLHDETAIGEVPKEPTQKLAVANTLGRIFAGKSYFKTYVLSLKCFVTVQIF